MTGSNNALNIKSLRQQAVLLISLGINWLALNFQWFFGFKKLPILWLVKIYSPWNETNSSPLKLGRSKRKFIFQPLNFGGRAFSFREGILWSHSFSVQTSFPSQFRLETDFRISHRHWTPHPTMPHEICHGASMAKDFQIQTWVSFFQKRTSDHNIRSHIIQSLTSWWFQPIWKILVKLDHFSK